MNNPLVSVIIPNYNHAKYLDERIQSILNQTYQDFELIILDDKSTDNSLEIIKKYKDNQHISHIVVNEENSGSTFKQWHKGFELAKGEWVWIAESDDYCDEDLLEKLISVIKKGEDVAVVYCTSQTVDTNGKKIGLEQPLSDKVDYIKGSDFIRNRMLVGNAIPNASSTIFKKEYALKADRQYMNYVAAGDRLFWIELAEMGNVAHLHSPKNYFRQHQNKVSPWKERAGITSEEDYKIFRYLKMNHYIGIFCEAFVRSQILNHIEKIQFDDEMVMIHQQKIWSYDGKVPVKWLLLYGKLYQKINDYFFELPLYELKKYGLCKTF